LKMNDPFQSLELIFQKADSDLQFVVHRLEAEFNKKLQNSKQNPLKIIQRIKRIQEDLPVIQEDIERIVACKQSLLEDSQRILFSNGMLLERLQMSVGDRPLSLGEIGAYKKGVEMHPSYQQFNNVIENWEKDAQGYTLSKFLYPTKKSSERVEEKNEKMKSEQSNWISDSDSNDTGLLINREDLNANILRTAAAIPSLKPLNPQSIQVTQSIPQTNQETEPITDDFKPTKKERSKNSFEAVSEEEFMSLGSTVRGKCRLADVNKLYKKVWNYFKENSKTGIVTVTIPTLVNQGAKVTGLSGETALNILRCLKLVEFSKKGISLVK